MPPRFDSTQGSHGHHVKVAIIGCGFAGLGMAIRLKQRGMSDFTVFEQAESIGGTWRDNSYPGCACDVESLLYSFSFAPHASWSRSFSPQGEILAYLRDCARRFGVDPHVRLATAVEHATWSETEGRWHLETSRGAWTADILIAAKGPLSEPHVPHLEGIETFRGRAFHSARWDHDLDLKGRRVAVVGTGASAIQFVPEIQLRVEHLTLLQRTPAWVLPRVDRPFSPREHRMFKALPAVQELYRQRIYLQRELLGATFRHPRLLKLARRTALRHMARAIASEELRLKLTPSYELGCKRVLLSNDYYPALAQSNVDVVTAAIKEVRPASILTADGVERPVDTIIYGTGFRVTDTVSASQVTGAGGKTLAAAWQRSPRAHVGTTVAGFPNLFLLLGPNTGLGHSSVLLMLEAQIEHVLGALRYMESQAIVRLEPQAAADAAWQRDVEAKSRGTVWTSGNCQSWYLDETGRNSVIWPGSVPAFRRRVARFRPEDYVATRGQTKKSSPERGASRLTAEQT